MDSRSVHAFIIGEHGDSEIAAWSGANISGIPLSDFCELRGHYEHEKNTARIAEQVKNSAYEIIEKKQATYYGIAMSVKRICEVILRDEKSILPVSSMMYGEYGISDAGNRGKKRRGDKSADPAFKGRTGPTAAVRVHAPGCVG